MSLKNQHDDEISLDTRKMSEAERNTFEVSEAAREKDSKYPSFSLQLFMGRFESKMLHPFPHQSAEEKKIGDELCQKVEEYLQNNLDADEVDETRTIPDEVIKGLKEIGLFALKIPKDYGGLGLSQINYNRIMMKVASYCGSTAALLSAHQSIGVSQPLKNFGTPEQKKKYLPQISNGAISAFALTEPDVGSDPAQMKMTATLSADGKYYLLNGDKLWCTNGLIADLLIVMAKTEPKIINGREKSQITAFIVEAKIPEIEIIHRCDFMGIRGIQNGLLRFTDVKVPVENILWDRGRGLALALQTLNVGRLTIPATCVGMAKQCLTIIRKWGKERIQWGKSVVSHEAGGDKVAFIASMTMALEGVTWLTSDWADQSDRDIRIDAAIAKLFCSEAAWKIIDLTMQLRGGRGYEKARSLKERGEEPFPVERMLRDARINTIVEGTSEIMRLFSAREALDPHLKRASGILRPGTSVGQKIKTLVQLMGFYGRWYPLLWVKGLKTGSYRELGQLARHYRYIEKTAPRLARALIHKCIKYGPGLEKKQLILGHLVDIGAELFAMGATVSYAIHLRKQGKDENAITLADHFCELARDRISGHFQALKDKHTKSAMNISQLLLDERLEWQEEGTTPIKSF